MDVYKTEEEQVEAIKKWWNENANQLPKGQLIGRPTWDWMFRIQMARSVGDTSVWSEELEKQGSIIETPRVIYHEKHDSYWEKQNNTLIYTIKANRFLHHMVRFILGMFRCLRICRTYLMVKVSLVLEH